MAAVADACAHIAREQADAAQRTLSEVKVWLALLPDGAKLELIAPKLNADAPADVLGVRPRPPVPRPDREEPACLARTTSAPASSATASIPCDYSYSFTSFSPPYRHVSPSVAMARAAAGSPAGGPSGHEGHHPHPAKAAQRPS